HRCAGAHGQRRARNPRLGDRPRRGRQQGLRADRLFPEPADARRRRIRVVAGDGEMGARPPAFSPFVLAPPRKRARTGLCRAETGWQRRQSGHYGRSHGITPQNSKGEAEMLATAPYPAEPPQDSPTAPGHPAALSERISGFFARSLSITIMLVLLVLAGLPVAVWLDLRNMSERA